MTPPESDAATDRGIDADAVLAGRVVDIAGTPIRLHASDARRADAVASLFRHAVVCSTPPVGTLDFGEAAVALPATDPDVPGAHADLWRPAPGELRIRNPEGLTASATADKIEIGGDAASLARVFRYTCFLALTHLLAQHGRHLLHAGAVMIEDRAVVVLGDTGSGKSTLVFAAHRLGWPVLSDDVIAVQRAGDELTVQGLPRPVSVPRDVADAIPGGRPVPEDHRARTELPGGTLMPDARTVHAVVLMAGNDAGYSGDTDVTRDPGGVAVERLGSHDTLRAALRAGPSFIDPAQQPEMLAIAAALARRPAWRLRHGADPTAAIADATRLLEAVHRRLGGDDPSGS